MAIDVFLECNAKNISGRSNEKMVDVRQTMTQVWESVDFNGDGMLSGEETEELVRSVLSRPALGKLLIEMVCSDVVNSTWSTAPDAKEVLSTLVSTVVCNMAKNVKTISQDL